MQLGIVFGNASVSLQRPGNKRSQRDGAEGRHFISAHCFSSQCLFQEQFRSVVLGQVTVPVLVLTAAMRRAGFLCVFHSFPSSLCLELSGLNCICLNTSGIADLGSVFIVFRQHQKHHTALPRWNMFLTASKKSPTAASAHCSCTNTTLKTSTAPLRGLLIGFL